MYVAFYIKIIFSFFQLLLNFIIGQLSCTHSQTCIKGSLQCILRRWEAPAQAYALSETRSMNDNQALTHIEKQIVVSTNTLNYSGFVYLLDIKGSADLSFVTY